MCLVGSPLKRAIGALWPDNIFGHAKAPSFHNILSPAQIHGRLCRVIKSLKAVDVNLTVTNDLFAFEVKREQLIDSKTR